MPHARPPLMILLAATIALACDSSAMHDAHIDALDAGGLTNSLGLDDGICQTSSLFTACDGQLALSCFDQQLVETRCSANEVCQSGAHNGGVHRCVYVPPACSDAGGDCTSVDQRWCVDSVGRSTMLASCVEVAEGCGRLEVEPCGDGMFCHDGDCLPDICATPLLCTGQRRVACHDTVAVQCVDDEDTGCPVFVEWPCEVCVDAIGCVSVDGESCDSSIPLPVEGGVFTFELPVRVDDHNVCEGADRVDLVLSVTVPAARRAQIWLYSSGWDLHATDCAGRCDGATDEHRRELTLTNDDAEPRIVHLVAERSASSADALRLNVSLGVLDSP